MVELYAFRRNRIKITSLGKTAWMTRRLTKSKTLVRRGKKWFRYDAPDKRLFKPLQKTLTPEDSA